jgi:hypothetical protein
MERGRAVKSRATALLLAFALCLQGTTSIHADESRTTTISDLAWLAGHWVDDSGGNLSEETWGPPSGDCMVGMWRLVVGGKAKLYEMFTITAEPEGLVMRLRHFDRSGVGWEEKDRPLVLKLVRSKEKEAVFQGPGTKGLLRLTYRRVDAETLSGVLERGTSDADAERDDFLFRRKPL